MLNIPLNYLKAALLHSAKQDVRHYLNGVRIEFRAPGMLYIVATDGNRALVGRMQGEELAAAWFDCPQAADFGLTIPAETVKLALAAKSPRLALAALPDGRYTLGSQVFLPVDGRFPDWQRILPKNDTVDAVTQVDANWDLVADAQAALRVWCNNRNALTRLRICTTNTYAIVCESPDVVSIVMAARLVKGCKPIAPILSAV